MKKKKINLKLLYLKKKAWSQVEAIQFSGSVKNKICNSIDNQKHSDILFHNTNGCHKRTAQHW